MAAGSLTCYCFPLTDQESLTQVQPSGARAETLGVEEGGKEEQSVLGAAQKPPSGDPW